MAGNKQIMTGIDKLVELIEGENGLSVADAAKKLGLSVVLVEEWGNFLEEEGVILLEYKLSGAHMSLKKASENEIRKDEKNLNAVKKEIVENIQRRTKEIKNHSEDIIPLKKDFKEFFAQVSKEFGHISDDVEALRKLEEMEDHLDKKIISYERDFSVDIKKINDAIDRESARYAQLLNILGKSHKLSIKRTKEMAKLKQQEKIVYKNLDVLEHIAESLSSTGKAKESVVMLKKAAKSLRASLSEQRREMDMLLSEKDENRRKVNDVSKTIVRKIASSEHEGVESVRLSFENSMSKRRHMKKLLNDAMRDTIILKSAVTDFMLEAKKLDKISGTKNLSSFSEKIKKAYDSLEKKHAKVHKDYHMLTMLMC